MFILAMRGRKGETERERGGKETREIDEGRLLREGVAKVAVEQSLNLNFEACYMLALSHFCYLSPSLSLLQLSQRKLAQTYILITFAKEQPVVSLTSGYLYQLCWLSRYPPASSSLHTQLSISASVNQVSQSVHMMISQSTKQTHNKIKKRGRR